MTMLECSISQVIVDVKTTIIINLKFNLTETFHYFSELCEIMYMRKILNTIKIYF